MQIWAEPGKIGPAHSQLFTNLISVFNVYTKLETVSQETKLQLQPHPLLLTTGSVPVMGSYFQSINRELSGYLQIQKSKQFWK